jgi:dephospho-CoA kinase
MLIPLQRMEVYGLTGGIGSGKSTVASLLEEYGIPVVSADELSRIVVAPGSEGLRQVVEEFGAEMVDEAGELDRGKMASLVFRNPERRRRLEEILHPRIRERFEQVLDALEKAGHEVAIYEVPLLFEKNLQGEMKAVILVTAPDHVRVARVRNRDDVTETEVRARMAAQMDEASKRRRADYVIENDGNVDDLRREVEFLIARFLRVGVGRRAPGVDEPATPGMIDDRERSYDPISAPAPSRRLTEVPSVASPSESGADVAVRTGSTLPPGVATSPSIASMPGISHTMPAPGISATMPAPGITTTMPAPGRTTAAPPIAASSIAPSPPLDPPTPPSMPRVGLPPLPGASPSETDESSASTMPLGARLPPEPMMDEAEVAAASRPTVVSVHEPPSAPPLRKPDAGKSEPGRPAAPRPAAPRRVSTLAAPTLGAPVPPPPPARPPSAIGRPGSTPVPPPAKPPVPGATPTVTASAVPPPPPRGRTERYVPVKEAPRPEASPAQTPVESPAALVDREPDEDA